MPTSDAAKNELQSFWAFLRSPSNFEQYRVGTLTGRLVRSIAVALLALPAGWLLWTLVQWLPQLGLYPSLKEIDPTLQRGQVVIVLSAMLIAPLIEELMFRWPLLRLARLKRFGVIFYGIAAIFGLIHVVNYEMAPEHWWFSLLITSPQFIAGLGFGYIRLTCGTRWAVASHMLFNSVGLLIQ